MELYQTLELLQNKESHQWENMHSYSSDMRLITRICKSLKQTSPTRRSKIIQFKNGQMTLIVIPWKNNCTNKGEKCWISLAITDRQTQTSAKHLTLIGITIIKNKQKIPSAAERVPLVHPWRSSLVSENASNYGICFLSLKIQVCDFSIM